MKRYDVRINIHKVYSLDLLADSKEEAIELVKHQLYIDLLNGDIRVHDDELGDIEAKECESSGF